MRIGSENLSQTSIRKAPRLGYMDYLKSTSSLDKAQVITPTGEVLRKSPHYQTLKEAETAYQSFYKLPSKIPEIKYKKKEEVAKKDQVIISDNYKNSNQLLNDKIGETYKNYAIGNKKEVEPKSVFEIKQAEKVTEIKPFKSAEIYSVSYAKFHSYQPAPVNKSGSKLDIYA